MVRTAVMALLLSLSTAGAVYAGSSGMGAENLDTTVASLRAASAASGRTYVGGGLRRGK